MPLARSGVARLRHRLELRLAPFAHADLTALKARVDSIDAEVRRLTATLEVIERRLGALLSAVSAANGAAELARRDLAVLRAAMEAGGEQSH